MKEEIKEKNLLKYLKKHNKLLYWINYGLVIPRSNLKERNSRVFEVGFCIGVILSVISLIAYIFINYIR